MIYAHTQTVRAFTLDPMAGAHAKKLTKAQSDYAVRVFARLRETMTQEQIAEALGGMHQSNVSRAVKGSTSLQTLTRAAVLAKMDRGEMEAIGIPVAHDERVAGEAPSKSDILRSAALLDGISREAIETWLRQRGALGLEHVRIADALLQMQGIMMAGRPIPQGNVSAVDDLLDAPIDPKGKKRRR